MQGKDIKKSIKAIAKSAGESLETAMTKLWENMTRDETVNLAEVNPDQPGNLSPDRLAKILLLTVASQTLDNEFNAETIKPMLGKARRVAQKARNR